jgi:restriction endonuclease S subunit
LALITRVNKSCLNLASRLDAEHYSPRFAPIHSMLSRLSTIKLRKLISERVRTGHTPSTKNPEYYSNGNVKFIKTDNLRADYIDTLGVHMLSERGNLKISASELHPDDIIVTIIGATEDIIARAARVYHDLGKANINQNIALIRSTLPSGYVTFFLNTKYGREQMIWLSRQTGQVNLNCREVEEILIPIFSNEFITTIHEINNQRHNFFHNSEIIYSEAESRLLNELGLSDWHPGHTLAFVRRYSDAAHSRRVDAEHFQPKFLELRQRIRNYSGGFCSLKHIALNSMETIEPAATPEGEFQYIELANINQTIGVIEDANQIKGKEAPSRARMVLRSGDVIASSVQGSLDKVALVSDEYHGAIGSTGFFVLRPRTVESGYLLALVKSLVVREQMLCEATGTILSAVSANGLGNIIVPIVPPEKRDEIDHLVQQSHDARREANALLEKAKRAIEIAIEQNEEAAIRSLQ